MVNEGAQLFRECEISIPREVWKADRARAIQLVEDFATELFVSDGMIADIGIHDSEAADGNPNVHAHIMLTMRRLETNPQRIEAGHVFAKNRERDWDCPAEVTQQISFANKKRDGAMQRHEQTGDPRHLAEAESWADKRQSLEAMRPINRVRVAWNDLANAALADIGSLERIDHRTLVAQRDEALRNGEVERAQALDREPLPRLSPMAKHIKEKVGVIADRANSFWASNARRQFIHAARAVQSLNGGSRARTFLRVTQVMNDMLEDWRENRAQRAMVPVVRLPNEDIDR